MRLLQVGFNACLNTLTTQIRSYDIMVRFY